MWTRGWRTSLPRGSYQRSCCKPRGVPGDTQPQDFISPASAAGLSARGMLGAPSLGIAKGKAGGRGLGCGYRLQDAASTLFP